MASKSSAEERLNRLEAVASSYVEERRKEMPAHILELFDQFDLPEQLAYIRDHFSEARSTRGQG